MMLPCHPLLVDDGEPAGRIAPAVPGNLAYAPIPGTSIPGWSGSGKASRSRP